MTEPIYESRKSLAIDHWETPVTPLCGKRVRSAVIKAVRYTPGRYDLYYVKAPDGIKYLYYDVKKTIKICRLIIDGKVWMIDDPPHVYAMREHAESFHGHVLVAGLGLGLIARDLAKREQVTKVTIVERCQDVIELIGPTLPKGKIDIVQCDWYDFTTEQKPDGVFYDLFVGDGRQLIGDACATMAELMRQYGSDIPIHIHGFQQKALRRNAELILQAYGAMDALQAALTNHAIATTNKPIDGPL